MDRDELVRLAGEQVLLQKEIERIAAGLADKKREFSRISCAIQGGYARPGWLEVAVGLLTFIHAEESALDEMHGRLRRMRELTGV